MSKQAPSFKIPLIDFSKFLKASNTVERRQTAEEIVTGFKEVGFIYLDKHGIPDGTVKNAFAKVNSGTFVYRAYPDCKVRAQSSSACPPILRSVAASFTVRLALTHDKAKS